MADPTRENPKNFFYMLPPGVKIEDVKQINCGIRPKAGAKGVYPQVIEDVTFTPDAKGVSSEPLASFGPLPVGKYICSAQTVLKAGGVSDWSTEIAESEFEIFVVKPNPPIAVAVA